MDYNTFTAKDYFKNLDLPVSVQENLMGRLNLQLGALSEKVKASLTITDEALATCKKRGGKAEESAKEWERCSFTCNSLITEAINQEVGSTAFMLKLLADSVIRTDGSPHRLKIGLDPSFYKRDVPPGASCNLLTGRWKEDAPFLRLVLPPFKDPEKPTSGRLAEGSPPKGGLAEGPRPSGRLIMGFGPSASGKTYWAKKLLGLLAQADDHFPDVFFSVDGGIVRESSAVYQFANEMAHCAGFAGFTNLHAGMFKTGDIKKAMEQYLLAESNRDGGKPISLYVPETLGKCEVIVGGVSLPGFSCKDYLKPFHEITRDKMWIGFLIWQHETNAAHMKDDAFKKKYPENDPLNSYQCAGCTESGRKREKEDGKPYDSGVYAQSMRNGRKYMAMAPGGKYEIHNAGCPTCISVMWDRSVRNAVSDRFSEIVKTMNKGNDRIEYVDERSGLIGVPEPREKNGYTTEGERMMADETKRKAAVAQANAAAAQAKRNANAAAAQANAAAQKMAANLFPKLPPGYTNARKQALVNAEKERRKTLKTAHMKKRLAAEAAEVSLSRAKERLRFARLDKERNATKTSAYDNAVRYVTAAEKAAKEARANAEDAERAASVNVEINLGLPENAERDARMAQRLANEKAARAASAKEDAEAFEKATAKAAEAVEATEAAIEQEREKSRAAHDRRAKKPNEITERAFQDAVAAVEAAVSHHTAAVAALRAAKEVERVRGITRVAWRESTKNPMTEEEKVAAQTIRDTAVLNATTAATAARAAAAAAKATAATTSAQASASAAEAEEEIHRRSPASKNANRTAKAKAVQQGWANKAKTLKKASAQIQSASNQAAANDRNRQERAARAARNALNSGAAPKPSVSRFANIGMNGNSIIPNGDPNALGFP